MFLLFLFHVPPIVPGPLDQPGGMGDFPGGPGGMPPNEGQGPPNPPGPPGGFMGQGNDLLTQPRSSPDYMPPGESPLQLISSQRWSVPRHR